jgi:hypothetical protein
MSVLSHSLQGRGRHFEEEMFFENQSKSKIKEIYFDTKMSNPLRTNNHYLVASNQIPSIFRDHLILWLDDLNSQKVQFAIFPKN